MTTKQLVEQVLETFPNYTETMIKLDLNRVYKDFCYKTRILKKSGNLTLEGATVGGVTGIAVRYAVPTDFQEIIKVQIFNADDVELDTFTYKIESGYITFYDEYSQILPVLPLTVDTITLTYIYIPTDLSALTGSPLIPDMFHEALLEGVYEKYYRRQGILQQHGASKQYYREAVIEGKKWANIDGDKTINITPHYF